MLMQLLRFLFTGGRGQALEEWERLVRQDEAHSSDTHQDTFKAVVLAHNPQDPEWRKHVGLSAAMLQAYDALRVEWKAVFHAYRQWCMADGSEATPIEIIALTKGWGKEKCKGKEKHKGKGKEKGTAKEKDKPKDGAPDTLSMKCFFCKEEGHARKGTWLANSENRGTRAERESHRESRLDLCFGPKPGHSQEPQRHCRR